MTQEVRSFLEIKEAFLSAASSSEGGKLLLGDLYLEAQSRADVSFREMEKANGKMCSNPKQAMNRFWERDLSQSGLEQKTVRTYAQVSNTIPLEDFNVLGSMSIAAELCNNKMPPALREEILAEARVGERLTVKAVRERLKLALAPPRINPMRMEDLEANMAAARGIDVSRMRARLQQQIEINEVIADIEAAGDYSADQMQEVLDQINARMQERISEARRLDMVVYTDGQYEDDPLVVMSLEEGYSIRDVREAYRRLAMQNHPDRGGDEALMAKITWARDQLLSNL